MDEYSKLLELAEQAAKPWRLVSYILALLLVASLGGNIYLAKISSPITLTSTSNVDSEIMQSVD